MNYYIASLKHTHKNHEHITFWGPNHRGYTPVIGPNIGEYDELDAAHLNDGEDYIAIPVDFVQSMQSPEPYFKTSNERSHRFYDQRGPVIENTRANWNKLIAASLQAGRVVAKPKPEVFRGKRRATFTE